MVSHRFIIMYKWQIEEAKARKEARNRAYLLIKKNRENKGYFKNAAGRYVERICYCHV